MAETTGYGQGGLKDMRRSATCTASSPLATERFAVADTDMTSQLNKMKAAGVDTLVVWAQGTPTGAAGAQHGEDQLLPADADSAGRPTTSPSTTPRARRWPRSRSSCAPSAKAQRRAAEAVRPHRAKLKAPSAFSFALHGYDSVQLVAAAIKQAGSTDGPAVKRGAGRPEGARCRA
jgi:branched-chain amino acid transport system substrate-binding protein